MKSPLKVIVTGAAGQIGNSLLFRIASLNGFGRRKIGASVNELEEEKALIAELLTHHT